MRFEFATATRVLFGRGILWENLSAIVRMGKRAIVATGYALEQTERLCKELETRGVQCTRLRVTTEPSVADVQAGIAAARGSQCDLVIGIGGGSVLDTAKAIAALLGNDGELLDYLEVIGRGKPLDRPSVPFVAIPTTAGTGSEVTRNAVLESAEHGVKVSIRSPWMLARLAIVDPELTVSMPPEVTAYTGLDALTQLLEAFVSGKANPATDAICREGMRHASRSLLDAYQDGQNMVAREGMSLASLFGGMALANAGLGGVHGFAGPLGGMLHAPHGALCASLLPHVTSVNIRALRSRAPDSAALGRYREIAETVTGRRDAEIEEGVSWISDMCRRLKSPTLHELGMRDDLIPDAVRKATESSSMRGNPVVLTEEELCEILKLASG